MFSVASEARVADARMSCRQGDTRGVVMTTVARQRAEIRVCYTHTAQKTQNKTWWQQAQNIVILTSFLVSSCTHLCDYASMSLPEKTVVNIVDINCCKIIFTARCYASAVLAMGLCLCLSVTSRSSTKTAKRRMTQTTPHDSSGTLVFWCQRSPRNSTGVTPYEGAECRWGGSKSATFDE